MNLAAPASFFRRLVARRQAPRAVDPADMGTVFGLEASLAPGGDDSLQEGDTPSAPGDESPMDWLGRRPTPRR